MFFGKMQMILRSTDIKREGPPFDSPLFWRQALLTLGHILLKTLFLGYIQLCIVMLFYLPVIPFKMAIGGLLGDSVVSVCLWLRV